MESFESPCSLPLIQVNMSEYYTKFEELCGVMVSGTIIRGTFKTPKSQLVTPISTKLQRPDG
jgi:hypothetical protein